MLLRTFKISFVFATFVHSSLTIGAETSVSKPVVSSEITELVQQLGDDDYDVREAAEDRLMQIGEPAAAEIERACSSTDPEQSYRARRLRPHLRVAPCLRRLRRFAQNNLCWEADFKAEATGTAINGHLKAKGSCFAFDGALRMSEKEEAQPVKIVSDGQTVWFESKGLFALGGNAEENGVFKISLRELEIENLWPFLFEKMFEAFELTGSTESNTGGVPVVVLEGKHKPSADATSEQPDAGKVRIQVPKERAAFLQLESFNAKNERTAEVKLVEIRAGKPPGEKDFVYEPPNGITVSDLTQVLKK